MGRPRGPTAPKTAAQRAAAYRARRRELGFGEVDQARQRTRMRQQRENIRRNSKIHETIKRQERVSRTLRRRRNREVALDRGNKQATGVGYNSVQTFAKAVKKATKGLPASPTRRRSVAQALAQAAGLKVIEPVKVPSSCNARASCGENAAKVAEFFRRHDISCQSPSRKNRIIIRERNDKGKVVQKTYIQKKFLMSIGEAYELYKQENPTTLIKKTKFYELRPAEVIPFSNMPHNVCTCKYHENMRYLCEALHPHVGIPQFEGGSSEDFLQSITCDPNNKICMTRQCPTCVNCINLYRPENVSDSLGLKVLSLKRWDTDENGRLSLCNLQWTLGKCFQTLKETMDAFLIHVYVKRAQSSTFKEILESTNGQRIAIQLDFAENFAIKSQHEVQSADWSHNQCTIFTAHVWVDKDTTQSYAVVSNELRHQKESVYEFVNKILTDVTDSYDSVSEVHLFTDGAASQFKQRYMMSLLHVFEARYGITFIWHFFASSHGKGIVDGIGATVKGAVWRRCLGGANPKNAKEVAEIAQKACPKINISFVSKEVIESNSEVLHSHWSEVTQIPRTQRMHYFRASGSCYLLTKEESNDLKFCHVRILPDP